MLRFASKGLAAASAATALLLGACAEPSVAPFNETDLDGDGRISEQEATHDVVLAGIFVELDANSDGELTPFEYIKGATRRR